MPIIQRETSIPANGRVDNVLTGSIYEFLPFNSRIDMGINAAATGLVATVNSGSDTVLEESPLRIATEFPVIPDEINITDVAAAGERLVVAIRNTTGAAIIARTYVNFTPV